MTIRQLNMLELFTKQTMGLDDALELNQLTFGSLCYQKWIDWNPRIEHFFITDSGKEFYQIVQAYSIHRLHNTGHLGKWATQRTKRRLHLAS